MYFPHFRFLDYDSLSIACRSECGGDDNEDNCSVASYGGAAVSVSNEDESHTTADACAEGRCPENPVDECFGSIIICTRKLSHRM